jgi:hypothetical protein
LLKDLAALAPPAVVCAAFLVGLVLLLRREMAPKRRVQEDAGREADISGNNSIIDANEGTSVASPVENPNTENADEREETRRSSGGHGSPN